MSLWDSLRTWITRTGVPFLVFALTIFGTALGSKWNNGAFVVVGVAAVLVSAIWLGRVVGVERNRTDLPGYRVAEARLLFSTVFIAPAFVAVKYAPEVVSFTAVGLAVFSGAAFLSEMRQIQILRRYAAPVLLGAGFVVAAVALVVLRPGGDLFKLLLVGVVLAELGTELRSEDWLRRALPGWHPLRNLAVGFSIMVVAAGLMVAGGTVRIGAVAIVGVVAILVWMAASDTAGLMLIVVAVAALLWANSSIPMPADANLVPQAGKPYFLVLGDSYISGEGAKRFYDGTNTTKANADHTNECRRAPTAWPVLLAEHHPPGVPARMLFLACSGALAAQIRTQPLLHDDTQKQNGIAELVLYKAWQKANPALGAQKPAFALLSVGGNDAGFGTIGQSCVGPGNCAELGDKFLDRVRKLEPKLDETYADVRAAVGDDVPVIVAPYPIPVTEIGACSPRVFLTRTERLFINAFAKELDRVVESAATRAGFSYFDTEVQALDKASLCEKKATTGLNFLGWNSKSGSLWGSLSPRNWTHNSLHPNKTGHQKIDAAAEAWFKQHQDLQATGPTSGPVHAVPKMAALVEFGSTALCSPPDARKCTIAGGGWLLDQARQLLRDNFLAVVLAAIGAWMFVIALTRYWRSLPWAWAPVGTEPTP